MMKNKCNCCQRNKFVFCFTDGGYNVMQCKNCDTYHIIDLDNIEIEFPNNDTNIGIIKLDKNFKVTESEDFWK